MISRAHQHALHALYVGRTVCLLFFFVCLIIAPYHVILVPLLFGTTYSGLTCWKNLLRHLF